MNFIMFKNLPTEISFLLDEKYEDILYEIFIVEIWKNMKIPESVECGNPSFSCSVIQKVIWLPIEV